MNTYNELGIKVTKTLDDLSMIVTSNLLSRINTMKLSGMAASEVRKVLVADLIAGGRIFGQLRNGVKGISKNAIEEAGNIAAQKAFEQQGLKQYKWISVGKNVCPDCKPRHGMTGDIEYFKAIGMPKSEFSVCGLNCNCMLVPIEYEGEDLSKPIKYKKPSPTDIKQAGKLKTMPQVEEWLKVNVGIKTVNFKGLGLSTANRITKVFKKHIDEGYKFKYKKLDTYRSKSNVVARSGATRIRFNTYHCKDTVAFEKGVAYRAELSGWWASNCNTFESMITHEFGHGLALDTHVRQIKGVIKTYSKQGEQLKALHIKYKKEIKDLQLKHQNNWIKKNNAKNISEYYKWIRTQSYKTTKSKVTGRDIYTNVSRDLYKEIYGNVFISNYAKANIDEWIAEGFTMGMHSNNPSPYALQIRNIILGVE